MRCGRDAKADSAPNVDAAREAAERQHSDSRGRESSVGVDNAAESQSDGTAFLKPTPATATQDVRKYTQTQLSLPKNYFFLRRFLACRSRFR